MANTKRPKATKKKIIKTKRGRGKMASRATATRVLAQGAGALPRRPFGSTRRHKKMSPHVLLDARLSHRLGLPRPVGPYTTIRVTKQFSTSAKMVIFGPWLREEYFPSTYTGREWLSTVAAYPLNAALACNYDTNTFFVDSPLADLGAGAEAVPSKFTVQVMKQQSLNTSEGLFMMARINQMLPFGGSTVTWDDLHDRVMSYCTPRLLTGGKLALRGVTCSAYPLNMDEYAHFGRVSSLSTSGDVAADWSSNIHPGALSPIVFLNETQTVNAKVTFLVTMEVRVRFDPLNPAMASHSYHAPMSDGAWGELIKGASDLGHGVVDIVESIADAGAYIGSTGGAV